MRTNRGNRLIIINRLPDISENEITPLIAALLEIIQQQSEAIQFLRDEIARLKGEKGRPTIRPSRLEKPSGAGNEDEKSSGKRPGSEKVSKTKDLEIHETKVIAANLVPEGSVFKGYLEYTVQDLEIRLHNVRYRVECWRTIDGKHVRGELPQEVSGSHFGTTVKSFILYQHYQQHVTRSLILEGLKEWGIQISAGQLDRILTEGKEEFHREKDRILAVGLQVSSYVNVDETGARHAGKNGYATHIGNDLFAWFASTESKRRINFLELLRAGQMDYMLNEEALAYMQAQGLSEKGRSELQKHIGATIGDEALWKVFLAEKGIIRGRHIRIATEGALLGSVIAHGFSPAIISDDAGQFNILVHGLCWVHAERIIAKLIGFNDVQREAVEKVRSEIWAIYRELKSYKKVPTPESRKNLETQFDAIFLQQTCFVSLNLALKRLYHNKDELLLVLKRPEIPIHNNTSERDIREYVKRRKISGGTRSNLGRQCRDTFVSLKKTCRKLGISFWDYLLDRVSGNYVIPQLPDLILAKTIAPG